MGFAFAEEAGDAIKELEVDGGDGCVAPSAETVSDGSYPLSRSLFIYVSAEAAARPEVAAYVDYYVSDEAMTTLVEEVGYIALPSRSHRGNPLSVGVGGRLIEPRSVGGRAGRRRRSALPPSMN